MKKPDPRLAQLAATMPEQPVADLESALQSAIQLAVRWNVELQNPMPGATCSVTLAGIRAGRPVVLRVSLEEEERTCGFRALRAFEGRGGVALLERDEPTGAVLMPRLLPGNVLEDSQLTEEEKIVVCASLSLRFQEAPQLDVWSHERWFQELWSFKLPPNSPVNAELLAEGRFLAEKLLASTTRRTLLHGDLHHYNILQSGSEWVAIDPKGLWADPAFEPVAFLRNPVTTLAADPNLEERQRQRIELFAQRLSEPAERIWAWAVAQISLDAAWSNGEWSEAWAKIAEATYSAGMDWRS